MNFARFINQVEGLLVVKLSEREQHPAFLQLLLRNILIETCNSVRGKGAHRTRAIQKDYTVDRMLLGWGLSCPP